MLIELTNPFTPIPIEGQDVINILIINPALYENYNKRDDLNTRKEDLHNPSNLSDYLESQRLMKKYQLGILETLGSIHNYDFNPESER
ncbi:11791_t:CDS:2 [Funneliformis geosporum]|uniref:11791_t:CDS:1 n=1 Tax=Funneliformis geosporum TaxID=1117311 RepID=A0A9W4SNT3_9GLOM|nr:11791_t:CDS:2 [Funneliformis geosporum]